MDAQEIRALLAKCRARRARLRRVDPSGMNPRELRQYELKLGRVEVAIDLGEQLLERAVGRSGAGSRDQGRPVAEAGSDDGGRPLFHRDEFECWLPELGESLLAGFEVDQQD